MDIYQYDLQHLLLAFVSCSLHSWFILFCNIIINAISNFFLSSPQSTYHIWLKFLDKIRWCAPFLSLSEILLCIVCNKCMQKGSLHQNAVSWFIHNSKFEIDDHNLMDIHIECLRIFLNAWVSPCTWCVFEVRCIQYSYTQYQAHQENSKQVCLRKS